MTMDDHLEVQDHGTIVMLRPVSEAARAWFAENVQGEGPDYLCDRREAEAIVWGAAAALLPRH
jgi:hypothetical protein